MNSHIASGILRAAAVLSLVSSSAMAQPVGSPNVAGLKTSVGLKDYGLKAYLHLSKDLPHAETNAWRLVCQMPYNCHFQAWILRSVTTQLQVLLIAVAGWMNRHQQAVIAVKAQNGEEQTVWLS